MEDRNQEETTIGNQTIDDKTIDETTINETTFNETSDVEQQDTVTSHSEYVYPTYNSQRMDTGNYNAQPMNNPAYGNPMYGGQSYGGQSYGNPPYSNAPYNNTYYSNIGGLGGNNGGNGNGYFAGMQNQPEEPKKPEKPKKKRIWLKVGVGVLAAAFIGLGSYGVYDHFAGDNNNSTVADSSTNTNDDQEKDSNTNKDDNSQGALSENGNSDSDVVVQQTTTTDATGDNKVVSVSENTQPSIVAINITVTQDNPWGQAYQSTGSGSGIIIKQTDSTLLIATNNHVVESATNLEVVFTDGESVKATVKGTDSTSDLAVVEVKLSDIKASTLKAIKVAALGTSNDLKVGEMVVAIGNALGYGQSVTVGYISAKEREVTIDNKKMLLLQTDAAINPGNSGGALLNLNGEVIGINSAKFASEDVEGIGYAIPISDAIPIINDLVDREVLKEEEKGYIGISGTTVTEEMNTNFKYPYGVYVSEVAKDGAADKGGMKVYDVITKLNGKEITTIEGFKERLNGLRAGTEVEITVQRIENGAYVEKNLKITLQDNKVLDGLESGDSSNQDNSTNGNDNNDGNTDPYGNTNPYGNSDDDQTSPYDSDEWPWNLFQ